MNDRRGEDRRTAFVPGCITFEQDDRTVFCLVHDLSRSGAKLEVAQMLDPPDSFLVTIDGEVGTFRAEMIWRRDFVIGVRFIGRS